MHASAIISNYTDKPMEFEMTRIFRTKFQVNYSKHKWVTELRKEALDISFKEPQG